VNQKPARSAIHAYKPLGAKPPMNILEEGCISQENVLKNNRMGNGILGFAVFRSRDKR
jgi:hypothetical protein